MAGKGDKPRNCFSKAFKENCERIFPRKTGAAWVKHLNIEPFIPIGWRDAEDFNIREISLTEFYERKEQSVI